MVKKCLKPTWTWDEWRKLLKQTSKWKVQGLFYQGLLVPQVLNHLQHLDVLVFTWGEFRNQSPNALVQKKRVTRKTKLYKPKKYRSSKKSKYFLRLWIRTHEKYSTVICVLKRIISVIWIQILSSSSFTIPTRKQFCNLLFNYYSNERKRVSDFSPPAEAELFSSHFFLFIIIITLSKHMFSVVRLPHMRCSVYMIQLKYTYSIFLDWEISLLEN